MTRLVRAEFDRLTSRRLTLILVLGVVAILGLLQLGLAQAVAPPSPEQVAMARQGYEEAVRDWEQNQVQYQQQCQEQGGSAADCVYPRPTETDFGLAPTPFAEAGQTGVLFSVVLTMLASYLLAASLIGAEYTTGSLSNWLTFVPQRDKVFAAKLVAQIIASAVLGLVTGGLTVGILTLITRAYDQPLTGAGDLVAMAARGIALAVFAGILGFCAALLTRYTVAALGVFLGYLLLSLGVSILSFLVPAISLTQRWTVENNVQAFLNRGFSYLVTERQVSPEGVSVEPVERFLGFGAASAYWAVLLTVIVAVSLLVFRRRDVV